jgi:hypothetical protein
VVAAATTVAVAVTWAVVVVAQAMHQAEPLRLVRAQPPATQAILFVALLVKVAQARQTARMDLFIFHYKHKSPLNKLIYDSNHVYDKQRSILNDTNTYFCSDAFYEVIIASRGNCMFY